MKVVEEMKREKWPGKKSALLTLKKRFVMIYIIY